MPQYISHSEKETKRIATTAAQQISHGVIALTGELGAGKTIFVQGFAEGLGIKEKIVSPTFVLIRIHKVPKGEQILYHVDLYRLENDYQIKNLGLEEIINNPNNLVLIEWAEKIGKYLPKETIKIFIQKQKGNQRLITVS